MSICIPKEYVDEVSKIVQEPSSITRQEKLTKLFGGNKDAAQEVNLLYEKTLLLKKQETAFDKFIDRLDGTNIKDRAEIKQKLSKLAEEKKSKIENDELLSIVKEVSDRKYGLDLTPKQVEVINVLNREVNALKPKMEGTVEGSPERMTYGRKVVELSDVVTSLINKRENLGVTATVKDILKTTGERFTKKQGLLGNIGEAGKIVSDVVSSAIYKSIQASADISFALRQGFKVLTKSPKIWKEQMAEAFGPIKNMRSKAEQQRVFNEFKARIVSDPMYDTAVKSKLAIGVVEDYFPTTLAEKIPVLGRVFQGSNAAFSIFSQGARMGLFKDMYAIAEKSGRAMTPELAHDIAKLSNSISGRGSLGKGENVSGIINKIFYSGRFIRSQLDTFIMPFDPRLDPFVRGQALKSSVATLGTIASLVATASLFTEVETDPRSSKFLKAKIPGSDDRWVDLSAGLGSYITLATRIATQETKSANTGKITKLNSGKFGSMTTFDTLVNFSTNKLAPAPSSAVSYLKGKDFSGKQPTAVSTVSNIVVPITAGDVVDAFSNEDTSVAILSSLFNILGASQTNYGQFKK